MELRHLRCFIAVAEELHFTRAAERLHIEQSPLSRTIKELETDLGIRLFDRSRRGTQLTAAGHAFWENVHHVFTAVEQACTSAIAAANGYHGVLRIAVSDRMAPTRLAALLTMYRERTPEVEIRLFEVSLAEQVKGLRENFYDAGFTQSVVAGQEFTTQAVWTEPVMLALPKRHPLLVYEHIPIEKLLDASVIMFHPKTHAGYHQQIEQLLRAAGGEPCVAQHVMSLELLIALVAAGYGVGLFARSQMLICQCEDIIVRPLASETAILTTYLLRTDQEPSQKLERFIATLHAAKGESASGSTSQLT